MPFLRFSRDRRGIESTFLLHARAAGERPDVLYWFRSAPGVRVGRAALDPEAMRTLELRYTDIVFDWPAILEVGAATPVEVEKEWLRSRRPASPPSQPRAVRASRTDLEVPEASAIPSTATDAVADAEEPELGSGLLEQLVGAEIASRLRTRASEIALRLTGTSADAVTLAALQAKAEALDPRRWTTPEAVLQGIQRADLLYEELRAALVRLRD